MVRKHYFIKKGLQTRFIGTVLLIVSLVMVVIFCNLYFFGMFLLQEDSETLYENALMKLKADLSDKLMGRLVLLGLVNVIIVVLISLFFSHQIAGPVYKLEKTLQRIIDGDVATKFSFRKSDRFDEVAELLNDMKDGLTDSLKTAKEVNEKSIKLLDEAIAKKDVGALNKLRDLNSQLANALNDYKFENEAAAPQAVQAAQQSAENKA